MLPLPFGRLLCAGSNVAVPTKARYGKEDLARLRRAGSTVSLGQPQLDSFRADRCPSAPPRHRNTLHDVQRSPASAHRRPAAVFRLQHKTAAQDHHLERAYVLQHAYIC